MAGNHSAETKRRRPAGTTPPTLRALERRAGPAGIRRAREIYERWRAACRRAGLPTELEERKVYHEALQLVVRGLSPAGYHQRGEGRSYAQIYENQFWE